MSQLAAALHITMGSTRMQAGSGCARYVGQDAAPLAPLHQLADKEQARVTVGLAVADRMYIGASMLTEEKCQSMLALLPFQQLPVATFIGFLTRRPGSGQSA